MPSRMRPPHLPRVSRVVVLVDAAVSVVAASADVTWGLSAVNVIGAAAVPSATIAPPRSTTRAGARPLWSCDAAYTVTSAWMNSVAPDLTNVWHASTYTEPEVSVRSEVMSPQRDIGAPAPDDGHEYDVETKPGCPGWPMIDHAVTDHATPLESAMEQR